MSSTEEMTTKEEDPTALKRPRSTSESSSHSSSSSSSSSSQSSSSSSYSSSEGSSDDEAHERERRGQAAALQLETGDHAVHGVNPQNTIPKILRDKVFTSGYWKEHCFALTSATIIDKAMDLREAGVSEGPLNLPTPFLMLTMRMLQILPDRSIVLEFIRQPQFRYIRLLGAYYWRLVGPPADVYRDLEPLLSDYRGVVCVSSSFRALRHIDEVIWELLHDDECLGMKLPRITPRAVLEHTGVLRPRVSPLEHDAEIIALRAQFAAGSGSGDDGDGCH